MRDYELSRHPNGGLRPSNRGIDPLVGQYLPQKLLESPYGGEPYPYETAFVAADLNGTGRRDFHFRPGTQKRRRLGGAG